VLRNEQHVLHPLLPERHRTVYSLELDFVIEHFWLTQIEGTLSTDFFLKISFNLAYTQFHTFYPVYYCCVRFLKCFLILTGTTAFCQVVN